MHTIFAILLVFVTTNGSPNVPIFPLQSYNIYRSDGSLARFRRFTAREAKSETHFWLYTQKNTNNPTELCINDILSVKRSTFNVLRPVRIIIHGFLNGRDSPVNTLIKDAYLKKGDFNVIVVDWGALSGSLIEYLFMHDSYLETAESIVYVGKTVGNFTKFLHDTFQVSFDDMYLIGHSLGAHIAGFAGKFIYPHRFNTIFALDPARPDFESGDPRHMLNHNDANYVESIQTDANHGIFKGFGLVQNIGHAAFYPNYGQVQPGCHMISCSHSRAYRYFAESINTQNGFWARKCANMDEIINKDCTTLEPLVTMGGEPSQTNRSGVFYFSTNLHPPFAKLIQTNKADYVMFKIFSSKNKTVEHTIVSNSLEKLELNTSCPIRIIVSDFDSHLDYANEISTKIKDAYLKKGNLNVIIVDWSRAAADGIYRFDIFADDIGRIIANFTKLLNSKYNISFDNIYLIGEGTGAQIVGFAGHFLNPDQYNTIFVLDTHKYVHTIGAKYVEAIQANSIKHHGHLTFLLNFDRSVVNCDSADCKHKRACEYFVKSINGSPRYAGVKCESIRGISFDTCKPENAWLTIGGEPSCKNRSGIYYIFELSDN